MVAALPRARSTTVNEYYLLSFRIAPYQVIVQAGRMIAPFRSSRRIQDKAFATQHHVLTPPPLLFSARCAAAAAVYRKQRHVKSGQP